MEKNMFHGSYLKDDVIFLLKPVKIEEIQIEAKERLIQSGVKHYSEMLSPEYVPSAPYTKVFYKALELNGVKMAENLLALAGYIAARKKPVLVSLARAGTPVGVLLKRTLKEVFNIDSPHYSVSIIRDRGIDQNALLHILENTGGNDTGIIFIDGWTGKGVISAELKKRIAEFNLKHQTNISSDLYVLSDISGKAAISATTEDYLIPSSVLNSTVSGLISRSVLNDQLINDNDFHGCKFYEEYKESDLSLWFADKVMEKVKTLSDKSFDIDRSDKTNLRNNCERFIAKAMKEYNVKNINYIKPGIGETTRVLLRRVPDRILLRDKNSVEAAHLLLLAGEKNVAIEEVSDLPYKAVGIISNLEK